MHYNPSKVFVIIIIVCFIFHVSIQAQINERGIPFIKNYTAKHYDASEQNWSVVQDFRGLLYVGNQENGVLEFDGKEWRRIALPNNPSVRSLALDSTGTIYVGAVGEIGYLVPNEIGLLEYKSLKHKIDTLNRNFGDVWRTYASKDKVYFTTTTKVFVYDYKKIKTVTLPLNSFFSFLVDDILYTGNVDIGLQTLDYERGKTKNAIGGEFYKGKNIVYIDEYDETRHLIVTYQQGAYLYDKKLGLSNYLPIPSSRYDELMKSGIYDGTKISRDRFAFATLYKGISIIDNEGRLLYQISEDEGLQEDMSSFVFSNNKSDNAVLWVSLNNGVSKIEISSPINYFNDVSAINSLITFNNKLYITSDEGLYHLNLEGNTFEFIKDKIISSQSWEIIKVREPFENEQLLLATNVGIFQINDQKSIKIDRDYDSRTIYQSQRDPSIFYIGTLNGVLKFKYENGKWKNEGALGGFNFQIHNIAEDEDYNLWLGTYLNGVVKYDIERDEYKVYGMEEGLPTLKNVRIANINNELLFFSEEGISFYNKEEDSFMPYTKFGESFSDGSKGVLKIYQDDYDRIWFIIFKENDYWIEMLQNAYSDNFMHVSTPFKRLPRMSYQTVFTDQRNITWMAGPDGLCSFDNKIERRYDEKYSVLLRKVSIGQDSLIFGGTNYSLLPDSTFVITLKQNSNSAELAYHFNSVSFEFASPFFENDNQIEFSWFLEGFEDNWNNWSEENKASYNNLFEGSYTFKVKAKNVYDLESEIAEYTFRILPPWYRTILAYIVYILLFLLALRIFIKLYVRRLEKEKIRLEGIVKERTAEVVQQKEKIEMAYENVKLLSKIGQDVTANLSVDAILEVVYENVNNLMDARIFAIGIYNEEKNILEFLGKESKDAEIIRSSDPLDNEKLLSVWCFVHQQEIFINHYSENNHPFDQYDTEPDFQVRESLIYLPLTSKDKKIGIISVQSIQPNAYSDYHLNILKNLAVYTSIALDNAEAYEKIELQKEEIIAHRDEIEAQRDYVTKQRDQIAKQKQAITDSIQYAKRIQSAVLPPVAQISQSLPDHFILFKPRDIVSGDFYWLRQIDHYVVVTAADCTGHGVPGAFMSMLGVSFLNEIVRRKDITKASDVLNELRKYVKTSLRQTGKEGEAKDGMDMSLCVIDTQEYVLQFSGAYNPLYLFRNSELIEKKADKMPIGIHINEKDTFTNHELKLQKGDVLYLFSDGYPDQFGGDNGSKFKTKRFKQLLLEINQKSMEEQKSILDKTLTEWQGKHEQVDDITIFGIRIN